MGSTRRRRRVVQTTTNHMKAQAKRILGREAVVRTNRVVGSFQSDAAGTLSVRRVLPPRSMILSRSDKSGVVVMVNKFWVQVAVDGSTLVPVGRSVSARWQGQPACGAMWSALPIWLPNFASTIRAGSAIWTATHPLLEMLPNGDDLYPSETRRLES